MNNPGRLDRTRRAVLADLVALRPAQGTRRGAIRAAVTVATVLTVLAVVGRLDLSIYATFGAFASVYGGSRPRPERWRTQAFLGLLLTAAVCSGALVGLSEQRSWLAIPVVALWATTGAILSDRYSWRPPGPLFVVFAVATCSAIPTTPPAVLVATALAALTAAFAVALGVLETRWLPGRSWRPPPPGLPPPPAHRQRVQAIRCAVAVVIAGLISTTAGISHPYWAMIAAVVPLAARPLRAQVVRGVHRTLGTLVGLAVAAVLLAAPLPVAVTITLIAALQGTAELLVMRNYGLALVAITPLALLSMQLANPQPVPTLLVDRLVETLIGVAVGLVVAILTRDRTVPFA